MSIQAEERQLARICIYVSPKNCRDTYEKLIILSRMVPSAGFEPTTYRLGICCSIQLSYEGEISAFLNNHKLIERTPRSRFVLLL